MSRQNGSKEASLTSVLPTQAMRIELALLVAISTDTMRRSILSTFDPAQPESSSTPAEESLINLSDSQTGDAAAVERRRVQRERDLSSPRMQVLRRAALSFFDAWQIKVLRRMGEVLGVKSEAVKMARRDAAIVATTKAKEKVNRRYWDWAEGIDVEEDSPRKEPHFSPIPTRLTELQEAERVLILHSLLLLLLSLENYTAHSRVLLLYISNSLHLPISALNEHESKVAHGLLEGVANMSADESRKRSTAQDAADRKWKVGLATFAGAALIGVTGGLAAPLLAAGVGTVMGGLGLGATAVSGLLGTLAGSSVLIGGLFGAYGGKMTGEMVDQFAREVEDFRFLPISGDGSQHKLRVAIGVSGWVDTTDGYSAPWTAWNCDSIEAFPLRWESKALLRLGESLR